MRNTILPILTVLLNATFLVANCDIATVIHSFDAETGVARASCCCSGDVCSCSCDCRTRAESTKNETTRTLECSLYAAGCNPLAGNAMIVAVKELAVALDGITLCSPARSNNFFAHQVSISSLCALGGIFRPPRFS